MKFFTCQTKATQTKWRRDFIMPSVQSFPLAMLINVMTHFSFIKTKVDWFFSKHKQNKTKSSWSYLIKWTTKR